jgi:DNA repair protein RadA/Sms
MSKVKKAFFCKNCGYESPKWSGKCPSCNEWNTFIEEIIHKESATSKQSWKESDSKNSKSIEINDVETNEQDRIISKDDELNRVLGGGIVPGSLVLVAGEPGIGKSTLFLQDALMMHNLRILYISGE